jgi:hypothetical protein
MIPQSRANFLLGHFSPAAAILLFSDCMRGGLIEKLTAVACLSNWCAQRQGLTGLGHAMSRASLSRLLHKTNVSAGKEAAMIHPHGIVATRLGYWSRPKKTV